VHGGVGATADRCRQSLHAWKGLGGHGPAVIRIRIGWMASGGTKAYQEHGGGRSGGHGLDMTIPSCHDQRGRKSIHCICQSPRG
jgi:hypothetical protein